MLHASENSFGRARGCLLLLFEHATLRFFHFGSFTLRSYFFPRLRADSKEFVHGLKFRKSQQFCARYHSIRIDGAASKAPFSQGWEREASSLFRSGSWTESTGGIAP